MPKRVKHVKRHKEINQVAFRLPELSLEPHASPLQPPFNLSEYMSAIGRKGGLIGGKRRLKTMTSEERRKIAVRAAKARWKKGGN